MLVVDAPNWKRMASAARRRRAELGLLQKDMPLRTQPRIGIETIRRIEAGDQDNYRATTLAAYSVALDWPPEKLEEIARDETWGWSTAMPQVVRQIAERVGELEDRMLTQEEQVREILALLRGDASTGPGSR